METWTREFTRGKKSKMIEWNCQWWLGLFMQQFSWHSLFVRVSTFINNSFLNTVTKKDISISLCYDCGIHKSHSLIGQSIIDYVHTTYYLLISRDIKLFKQAFSDLLGLISMYVWTLLIDWTHLNLIMKPFHYILNEIIMLHNLCGLGHQDDPKITF